MTTSSRPPAKHKAARRLRNTFSGWEPDRPLAVAPTTTRESTSTTTLALCRDDDRSTHLTKWTRARASLKLMCSLSPHLIEKIAVKSSICFSTQMGSPSERVRSLGSTPCRVTYVPSRSARRAISLTSLIAVSEIQPPMPNSSEASVAATNGKYGRVISMPQKAERTTLEINSDKTSLGTAHCDQSCQLEANA